MTFPDLFRLYTWLIDTIRQSNGITLEEINKLWVRTDLGDGAPMSRSSFIRHKEEIADIFGVNIVCARDGGYKYFLDDREILKKDTVQNWMISTLSVNNLLHDGMALNDRILIESTPSSTWLRLIIDAMRRGCVLEISYKKYTASEPKSYRVEPYCLKLFKRRWYMLCSRRPEGGFRTFSLDRIVTAEKTEDRFELPGTFSAAEFYRESFGIVHDDTVAERIVLRAYGSEVLRMRDLPIHSSQKEIGSDGDKWTDFEFYLRPTGDFAGHIISRGSAVKVVEPLWLADQVREIHTNAAKLYDRED